MIDLENLNIKVNKKEETNKLEELRDLCDDIDYKLDIASDMIYELKELIDEIGCLEDENKLLKEILRKKLSSSELFELSKKIDI